MGSLSTSKSSNPAFSVNTADRNNVGSEESKAVNGVTIPKLLDLNGELEDLDQLAPVTAGSPTVARGVTDRSFVSRMSKHKLKEIPLSDARFSHSTHEHVSIISVTVLFSVAVDKHS